MKAFTSKSQRLGQLGEDIVCRYLRRKGYRLVERNHTRRWGEIDIIAEVGGTLRFIEVKAVSRELGPHVLDAYSNRDEHRPEDLVHAAKRRRIARTIAAYMAGKDIGEARWQFDVACVSIDVARRRARVKLLADIIL